MLDEAKYFIREPKAIEDLVNHVATILGCQKKIKILSERR